MYQRMMELVKNAVQSGHGQSQAYFGDSCLVCHVEFENDVVTEVSLTTIVNSIVTMMAEFNNDSKIVLSHPDFTLTHTFIAVVYAQF